MHCLITAGTLLTYEAHPLLAQIPLIVSPFYNPPKAVTLPFNYKPLPPQLPETNVTKDNLEAWIAECQHVKNEIESYGTKEKEAYEEWHNNVVRRLAPGYLGGSNTLLTPQRRTQAAANHQSINETLGPNTKTIKDENDIDRAFSTMNIR